MSRTGSVVVITYDSNDITSHVMFAQTSFDVQFSAIPGTFEMTLKDEAQTMGPFITGKEITLSIDGTLMFGGYLTQVTRKFAFPADRTDAASGGVEGVETRLWVLRGVDYNILFDKRVLRFSSAMLGKGFLQQLPSFYADRQIGDLVRNELCPKYLDLGGFDYTSQVEDVAISVPGAKTTTKTGARKKWAWCQQGTLFRKQMEDFTQFNGGIWYIDPQKRLHLHSVENMQSRWGFSDVPNHRPVAGSSPGFQGSTYGFRELDSTEDGSYITNDAMIWGGSEWAGKLGGTVFARRINQDSIDKHHRWQTAETHFGEQNYGIQEGVDVRAETIVEGTHSGQGDQLYGLKYPQWQFRFAWFGHDVPEIGGVRDHLMPGQLVTIWLYTFGTDKTHPLIQLLPLRQMRVTFPELDAQGRGYVQFEGFFGIQQSDPWTLWRYLLKAKTKTATIQIASSTNTSERAMFGSFGSFYPAEAPDGSRTDFSIFITVDGASDSVGYIEGTTAVYRNGILQRNQIDYVESDPPGGVIHFYSPPLASDWIWIQCRTMAA
jgi:hypothetical protein